MTHTSEAATRVLALESPETEAGAPWTIEELRRCIEILESVVHDRGLLAAVPDEERRALLIAAGRASRPESHQEKRLMREFRRARREREDTHDRRVRATTGIRQARLASVFVAPAQLLPGTVPPADAAGEAASGQSAAVALPELRKPKSCYVCKSEFTRVHFFYDSMCPECAGFNYAKRFQTARLDGRTALITGARLKIGYQASLMLLRAGARVIATTRFPHDAAQRYAREPDFAAWGDRLQVHGLDLRHSPSVELFARFVEHTYDRLDFVLNNAAQTVRRPPEFYAHLLELESRAYADLVCEAQPLLRGHEALKGALGGVPALPAAPGAGASALMATWHAGGSVGVGLRESARLSQIPYAADDGTHGAELFPVGAVDADLQQVDLRDRNTWRLTLSEVQTQEMLEVHLINAVAPFILCSKLKPLMLRDRTGDKHIVNVSAMEGIFSRGTKTDKHPHTNMAKAALNMMTLTSARDYVKDGIHMNAVDTGWVTDEDPAVHANRKREELDFQPPLDIVDGAARICDPIFSGLNTGVHLWGQFLKDYRSANW